MRGSIPAVARSVVALAVASGGALAHGDHDTGSHRHSYSTGGGLIPSAAAAARIEIDERNGYRYVRADGRADHATGHFPNRGNPNAIATQHYFFRMPLRPVRNAQHTPYEPRMIFGVAINGVVFDPGTAEYWRNDRRSGWMIEALSGAVPLGLDRNNAHVQPDGAYHYHGLPLGLVERLPYRQRPVLIGWAADGFPIYAHWGHRTATNAQSGMVELRSSWRLKHGMRDGGPGGRPDGTYTRDYEYVPGLGDLDECNGREGPTPEFPRGTYPYVVTTTFPYVPRCYVGTPDASFMKGPPAGGRPPGGRRPPPPGPPPFR
ncbi:MAG: YHYH protein [Reyranellaceae bacterium]